MVTSMTAGIGIPQGGWLRGSFTWGGGREEAWGAMSATGLAFACGVW